MHHTKGKYSDAQYQTNAGSEKKDIGARTWRGIQHSNVSSQRNREHDRGRDKSQRPRPRVPTSKHQGDDAKHYGEYGGDHKDGVSRALTGLGR